MNPQSLMTDRRVAAAVAEYEQALRALSATLPLPAIDAPDFVFAVGQARTAAEALTRALGVLGQQAATVRAIRSGPSALR